MIDRFWAEREQWPTDPPGWLFLGRAVELLWNARSDSETKGGPAQWEVLGNKISLIASISAFNPQSAVATDQARQARSDQIAAIQEERAPWDKVFHAVQEQLRKWAEEGDLLCGTRPVLGGPVTALPPVTWSTQSLASRFRYCLMHPRRPYDAAAVGDGFCHIFVEEAGLSRLLGDTEDQRVQSTGAAVIECEQWLIAQFKNEDTRGTTKRVFETEALKRFKGRLSKRGFLIAWATAVRQFPERSRRGRKGK